MLIDGVASGATVTCAANDQVLVKSVSTTQFKLSRVKYDGTAQVGGSSVVRSARTTNTILAAGDNGTLIDITSGTFSQTFTAAATLGSGWFCYYRNNGTGVVTLDPNAAELIDGAATLIMYPGDARLFQCTGTEFTTIRIKAGVSVAGVLSRVYLTAGNGNGSTNTNIRRFTTATVNTGTAITYADSATNGATFTINEPGFYYIKFWDDISGGIAIGLNISNESYGQMTVTQRLAADYDPAAAHLREVSCVTYLVAGDIIKASSASGAISYVAFDINKIAHV